MIAAGMGSVGMGTSKKAALFVLVCAAAVGCSASKGNLTARDADQSDHDGSEVHDGQLDVLRPDVGNPDVGNPDVGNPDIANPDGGVRCDPAVPPVALSDASVSPRSDADPKLPTDLVAPVPPEICCDVNAGAAACDLPPSGCATMAGADASFIANSQWIVFYENPRCVGGRCVWDQSYFQCQGGSTACVNGACAFLGTALP